MRIYSSHTVACGFSLRIIVFEGWKFVQHAVLFSPPHRTIVSEIRKFSVSVSCRRFSISYSALSLLEVHSLETFRDVRFVGSPETFFRSIVSTQSS